MYTSPGTLSKSPQKQVNAIKFLSILTNAFYIYVGKYFLLSLLGPKCEQLHHSAFYFFHLIHLGNSFKLAQLDPSHSSECYGVCQGLAHRPNLVCYFCEYKYWNTATFYYKLSTVTFTLQKQS